MALKATLCRLAGVALAAALAPAHAAEPWPAHPVRVVVGYPAGGGLDFVARLLAKQLNQETGQNFIVENRPGASGSIAAQSVVRSAPDGYTFLVASPAEVLVGPVAGQHIPYNPQTDLVPVTLAGETPLVVATNPKTPAKSLGDLLSYARTHPGKLSYGSPGTGSTMQFAGESLNLLAQTHILHVPYKGAAPAISDLLGNQIPMAIVGMPPVAPLAKTGKLKILAVTSSRRSSALPQVPTVAELPGFSGYRFTNWMGIYVPKGTPPEVVDRLASLVAKAVQDKQTHKQLLAQGVEPVGNTPAQFAEFLSGERQRYEAVKAKSHISLD
jgi:tripartite-type tricarboxylate transporter receptor subunit TctC